MSNTPEEALYQALQAVDAAISTLVVARNALVSAINAQAPTQPLQEPESGEVPAGCQHPNLIDIGVASGASMCDDCGETI